MPDWLIWLIVAGVLLVGEMLTLTFILGPVALAAALAAVVAALGAGVGAQIAVFALSALASLLLIRPIARRHLRTPSHQRTGTAKLVGEGAVVLERVDGQGGRVKLELGLARGRKLHDKRSALREREVRREMDRAVRGARRGEW